MITYPRHMHQRGGVYRIVSDAIEHEQALSEGWVDHPIFEWGVPDVYREWDGSLLESVPSLPLAPVRRGRPKKQE
jgi:hypothetical protein